MNITSIAAAFNRMSHVQSRTVNPEGSLPATLRDEQLKARALQRWENEGGRICPSQNTQPSARQIR